jgi:hypothetical protein
LLKNCEEKKENLNEKNKNKDISDEDSDEL